MNSSDRVVAFVCNWDGYLGLETAAQKGLTIPSSVNIVRVSCLTRLHPGLLLKAFELGAGGVILIGCSDHDCHYGNEKSLLDFNVSKVQSIMSLLGLKKEQLSLYRIGQPGDAGLVGTLIEFNRQIRRWTKS